MTDVRLTATNPEDSSVVPVACNAKGELKLEEPAFDASDYVKVAGDNMTGDLTLGTDEITLSAADGDAQFAGGITADNIVLNASLKSNTYDNQDAGYSLYRGTDTGGVFFKANSSLGLNSAASFPLRASFNGQQTIVLTSAGNALFADDVIVGSRGKQWMIVESGGIAHLSEQNFRDGFQSEYPQLRNIPNELTMVERALELVMKALRMTPPAGWEVWDESSKNS